MNINNKRIKQAAIGGGQDQPFEQAFANLAHTYMKDKAPGLLDYEVGFQLVDRNQENTKAIGVFGFKVGAQWLYAPVFFINGDLKGHELLYIKKQDNFVPLKENWLNYILNRKPNVLGDSVDKNLSQIGVMPPNLYQLSRSPHKFASAVDRMPGWAKAVMPDISYFATQNPLKDEKYKEVRDLTQFLKDAGANVTGMFLRAIEDYPELKEHVYGAYGKDNIVEAVKHVHSQMNKQASVISQPATPRALTKLERKKNLLGDEEKSPGDKIKEALAKIKVARVEDVMKAPDGLNQGFSGIDGKDKEELVRSGVVIKDTRSTDEVTLAYKTEGPETLTNPFGTGLYHVLTAPGTFEKCLVIFGPYSKTRRNKFCTVVRVEGNSKKSWTNIHPSVVWVSNKIEDKEFDSWWNDQTELKSLEVREKSKDSYTRPALYVIVSKTGEGTVPFSVDKEYGDELGYKRYEVDYEDYTDHSRAGYLPAVGPDWYRRFGFEGSGYDEEYLVHGHSLITLTEKEGGKMRLQKGELFVPAGCKLIKVRDAGGEEKEDDLELCCGNLIDIQMNIINKSPKLNLKKVSADFSVNGKILNRTNALIHLIRQYGLAEKQARHLLDETTKQLNQTYVLKYAAPFDLLNQGPSAPYFPDPYVGYDPITQSGVPTQLQSEHNIKIPELSASNTDRSLYNPMGPDPKYQQGPDNRSLEAAMMAAQTGQKEVFDTAMLGSLLKATRDENLVDRYMGDLMKGLDRLGRILFLFYWHQDEFEDRYGKQDMVELEDGLRNAFEAMGDIVLFLRQKTVDPNPEEVGSGPDLGSLGDD